MRYSVRGGCCTVFSVGMFCELDGELKFMLGGCAGVVRRLVLLNMGGG